MTGTPTRRAWLGGATALVALFAAGTAEAADCSKATNHADQLICQDPIIAAADSGMATIYGALRAVLSPDKQKALLDDQRAWLKQRGDCAIDASDHKPAEDSDAVACLEERTVARARDLAHRLAQERPGAPALVRHAVQDKNGAQTVRAAYPAFADAGPQAKKDANELLRGAAIDDLGGDAASDTDADTGNYEADYRVIGLTAHFASVDFSTYSYQGGAYPTNGGTTLDIDLGTGKAIALSDALKPDAAAKAAHLCGLEIAGHFKFFGVDFDPDDDAVASVAADIANWAFSPTFALLTFREDTIGPHAVGTHVCTLTGADYAALVKPGSLVAELRGK